MLVTGSKVDMCRTLSLISVSKLLSRFYHSTFWVRNRDRVFRFHPISHVSLLGLHFFCFLSWIFLNLIYANLSLLAFLQGVKHQYRLFSRTTLFERPGSSTCVWHNRNIHREMTMSFALTAETNSTYSKKMAQMTVVQMRD